MIATGHIVTPRAEALRKLAARARALDAALPGHPDESSLLAYASELERQADELETLAVVPAVPPMDYAEGGSVSDLPSLFRAAEAAANPELLRE